MIIKAQYGLTFDHYTPLNSLKIDEMKNLNSCVEEVRPTVEAIVKNGVKFAVGTDAHHGQ